MADSVPLSSPGKRAVPDVPHEGLDAFCSQAFNREFGDTIRSKGFTDRNDAAATGSEVLTALCEVIHKVSPTKRKERQKIAELILEEGTTRAAVKKVQKFNEDEPRFAFMGKGTSKIAGINLDSAFGRILLMSGAATLAREDGLTRFREILTRVLTGFVYDTTVEKGWAQLENGLKHDSEMLTAALAAEQTVESIVDHLKTNGGIDARSQSRDASPAGRKKNLLPRLSDQLRRHTRCSRTCRVCSGQTNLHHGVRTKPLALQGGHLALGGSSTDSSSWPSVEVLELAAGVARLSELGFGITRRHDLCQGIARLLEMHR